MRLPHAVTGFCLGAGFAGFFRMFSREALPMAALREIPMSTPIRLNDRPSAQSLLSISIRSFVQSAIVVDPCSCPGGRGEQASGNNVDSDATNALTEGLPD